MRWNGCDWILSTGLSILCGCLSALLLPPAQAVEDSAAPIQSGPGHRFACADYSQDKVFIVAADGHVEWEHAAPGCDDVTVLPDGHLLFTTRTGVLEVTPAKEIVFQYKSTSEIYACQRLPNGHTFVGECNAGRLLEVDPAGKIVHEIRLLPAGTQGDHVYMRNARRLANGNYLVTHYGLDLVREYDPQGRVVREIPARGGPHSVVRLPNGNTLIACGDRPGGPRVFEVDREGKTVWELTQADVPDVHLAFLGRPSPVAQRQHGSLELVGPRSIWEGSACAGGDAGQESRLDLRRPPDNARGGQCASPRHARGGRVAALALSRPGDFPGANMQRRAQARHAQPT